MGCSGRREFFARTVLLKGLKEIMGKDLLAVYLVGSAQAGVRKAGPLSDVDVVAIVPPEKEDKYSAMRKGLTRLNLLRAKSVLYGIRKADVHIRTPESFPRRKKPAQLLFGQNFMRSQ